MGKTHDRIDVERVRRMANLPDLARRAGLQKLTRKGDEYVALCPFHHDRDPSLTLFRDNGEWRYKCFSCGAYGDAITFVQEVHGLSFLDSVKTITGETGVAPLPSRPSPAPDPQPPDPQVMAKVEQRRRELRGLWGKATPLADTPALDYLRTRGITAAGVADALVSLRVTRLPYFHHHPGDSKARTLGTWPVIVSAIQNHNGAFIGLHQTYLTGGFEKLKLPNPDTSGFLVAKKMQGKTSGGAVRFGGWDWGKSGAAVGDNETLYVAEGIESALSVLQALRWAGETGAVVWAGLSLPNLKKLTLPACVGHVVLVADQDEKDLAAADAVRTAAVTRWEGEGRAVTLVKPPVGMDINDVLRQGHDALIRAQEAAA